MKKMRFIILILLFTSSCEKDDNSLNSKNYSTESCTNFEQDTTHLVVNFSTDSLLGYSWELFKTIDISSCIEDFNRDEIIADGIIVKFYPNDSVSATYINVFGGKYTIESEGEIEISEWGGTKINNTKWEQTFSATFPHADMYYMRNDTLVVFANNNKMKFIKAN